MLDEETLAIMRKMGLLSRLHKTMAEREMDQGGLYRSQMMVLVFLSKKDEPVSQKHIADRFEISKPAATEMLKRLEELGMVNRVPSKRDQRVKLISLTEKGRALTEENRECFMEMNSRMADGIPAEDMAAFSRVLDRMMENLRAMSRENGGS